MRGHQDAEAKPSSASRDREAHAQVDDLGGLRIRVSVRVGGEVERLQGRFNVLKNKTTLATIILTLHERQGFIPQSSPTFATQASRTFWGSLQTLGAIGNRRTLK